MKVSSSMTQSMGKVKCNIQMVLNTKEPSRMRRRKDLENIQHRKEK